MDPWSAVQCASAVVGFIDLAGRLVVGTYKTYTGASDLRATAKELENVRQRLRALGDGAKSDNKRSKSKAHTEFHELCGKCEEAIDSMLGIIKKVCEVGETNPSLWSSLKENVGKLWSTNDVGELQKQLEGYQRQLPVLMIAIIRSEHEASTGVILETHQIVQRIGEKVDQLGRFQTGEGSYHDKDQFADYLLHHLLYREMDDRFDAIHLAHNDTANWIFEYTVANDKQNFV
ncbi:hypothetical protein QBC43DRAFT_357612 [Cladorrhinum sp. PSN259]|nr:hypothetical protein QBC43DRAFT_357612 [Cladorrhinum sp. PSN259]